MEWGWRIKIFNIKNLTFKGGGVHMKKTIYRVDCLKRGALAVCRFKRGFRQKREGVVFLRGLILSNAHYGRGE